MNTPHVLMDCGFTALLNEAVPQTQTGSELINKYKSYLMSNPESCGIINQFFQEANYCKYDSGVNKVLEQLADYMTQNKVGWAIASVCENLENSNKGYDLLNRNAARQASKLLEMKEDDIVRYVRAGALKNVMFCEAFRNIAKSVFKDNNSIIETEATYTKITPCSMVENVGDGNCFVVAGKLYKMDDNKNIQEADWKEVSNTFKQVESLLESNLCTIDEDNIYINYNNAKYTISESNKITKEYKENKQEFTVESFRDNNRLVLTAINPRRKNEVASILEAIAVLAEQYDNVCTLDNCAIYNTQNDKFVVLESGENNLYSTLLQSNHKSSPWSINEDAIKTLDFIKKQTNVQLSEQYKDRIEKTVQNADTATKQQIKESLENQEVQGLKERIEKLTEKFKNDPSKLAILSQLASEV